MIKSKFWIKSPSANNPWYYELLYAEKIMDDKEKVKSVAYAQPVSFMSYTDFPATDMPPMMNVDEYALQSLTDALWLQGFRPSPKLTQPIKPKE